MATQDDVRRICSKLPGTVEGEDRFAFSVENKGKAKGFLWTWAERVHPKKARVINDGVLAVIVPSLTVKEIILGSDADKFLHRVALQRLSRGPRSAGRDRAGRDRGFDH